MTPTRALCVAALFVALAGAAAAQVHFTGGNGESAEKAVVIAGAKGESDGVAAEYDWLAKHRPGAELQSQAVMSIGGRAYDVLTVGTASKHERVFFDITSFFGK